MTTTKKNVEFDQTMTMTNIKFEKYGGAVGPAASLQRHGGQENPG